MKKLSLMIVILLVAAFVPLNFAFSAGEKTAKGRIELGGTVDFTHTSYENYSSTDISILPGIGYFVIPKLSLEPKLLIQHSSYSYESEFLEDYSATHFGAILHAVYHFEGAGGSKYVPFLFGGAGFASHSGDVGEADEMTMILPDIGGGIKIFVTNDAVIRAALYYQRASNAGGVKDADASEFGIRAGVSIFVK